MVHGFWPEGCPEDACVDGAFVVDSFFHFRRTSGNTIGYLPKLLAEIRADSGFVFVAIWSGGAAVSKPGHVTLILSNCLDTCRRPSDILFLSCVATISTSLVSPKAWSWP